MPLRQPGWHCCFKGPLNNYRRSLLNPERPSTSAQDEIEGVLTIITYITE
jgi:hypothetical protein